MNAEELRAARRFRVLQAFAEFRLRHRDALLYLHTQPRGCGVKNGVDLVSLARALGIENAVLFADEYVHADGREGRGSRQLLQCSRCPHCPELG